MTTAIPVEIAQALVDSRSYATNRIHNAHRWLRAHQPLGIAEAEGFHPFWAVTKHADILEVSRQNTLFHNADRPTTLTDIKGEAFVKLLTGGSPHLVRSLVQMDEPDHMKYRTLTQAWFMPANLKKLEDRIRVIAREAVEAMMAKGERVDFVADVALHYPLRVVMEILGVPREDEARMLRLTQELFGPVDPDTARAALNSSPEFLVQMIKAVVADFEDYFRVLRKDRTERPCDDLASVIANGQIDGAPMPDLESNGYYMIVATAGHDTTSSSTAGAIWGLAEDPAEFLKVKQDPSLIPSLVDEAIRWMTPVKTFMRSATADTELAGRKIAKGDWLMLCYASGNRDEDVFDEPDRFKVDRKPNKHLAFGYGAHLCLGQHLAKLEMRILFEELLPRIKGLSLTAEPRLTQSSFVNGPKSLPLHVSYA